MHDNNLSRPALDKIKFCLPTGTIIERHSYTPGGIPEIGFFTTTREVVYNVKEIQLALDTSIVNSRARYQRIRFAIPDVDFDAITAEWECVEIIWPREPGGWKGHTTRPMAWRGEVWKEILDKQMQMPSGIGWSANQFNISNGIYAPYQPLVVSPLIGAAKKGVISRVKRP